MDNKKIISNGVDIKVMRSYDYCHFEFILCSNDDQTMASVNEIRKNAQRLADEAVRQYQQAKDVARIRLNDKSQRDMMRQEIRAIKENFPQSEWTPEQKAKVKSYDDYCYRVNRVYDYQDEWEA